MTQTSPTRLAQLQQMLAAEPADVFLQYAMGMEHMRLQDWPAALTTFGGLLQQDPNYVAAYFMSGRALVQKGDVPAARAMLTRGIEVARRVGDDHAAGEMQGFLDEL